MDGQRKDSEGGCGRVSSGYGRSIADASLVERWTMYGVVVSEKTVSVPL